MENNEIRQVLEDVITTRNNNHKKYEKKAAFLDKWLGIAQSIKRHHDDVWKKIIADNNLQEDWNIILGKANDLENKIKQIWDRDNDALPFSRAKNRAARGYVNIAIAAAWRQGKSTFLRQSLKFCDMKIEAVKNASDYLVPVGFHPDLACTGTSINYINDDLNVAEITYYTPSEIAQNINKLIECVKLKGKSIEDQYKIKEEDLKTVSSFKDKINSINNALLQQLEEQKKTNSDEDVLWNYLTGLDDNILKLIFEKNGETVPIKLDSKEHLEDFYKSVCFYKDPYSHVVRIYDVLATREATVHSKFLFKNQDLGKIQFLDTPGIGEARTSVEDNLIETIQKNVDIIIIISKTSDYKVEDVKKFHTLLKKYFNYSFKDKNENSTKDFIFYVINVDTSSEEYPIRTKTCYESCIEGSLRKDEQDGKTNKIDINDSHIAYIDCKNNNRYYSYTFKQGIIGNDKTKENYIELGNPQNDGCATFIYEILKSLKNIISEIDDHFNHEALEQFKEVSAAINALQRQLGDFDVPDANIIVARIDNIASKIALAIEAEIDGASSIEDYRKKLKETYGDSDYSSKLVYDFLKKLTDSNVENEKIDRQTVIDTFKNKGDSIVFNYSYRDLSEFERYAKLKKDFRDYNIEKMSECLDISIIQKDFQEKVNKINRIFIDNETGKVFNTNNWIGRFVDNYDEKEYKTLAKWLKIIGDYKVAEKTITNYFTNDLRDRFHVEKTHTSVDTHLFETLQSTTENFINWLIDISEAIVTSILDETGNASIINKLKETRDDFYGNIKKMTDSLKTSGDGFARKDLLTFIEKKQKVIFNDIEERKESIAQWNNNVVSKIKNNNAE